jgi:hypothetical protein
VSIRILTETCHPQQENHHDTDAIHRGRLAGLLRPPPACWRQPPETRTITQQDIQTHKVKLETLTRDISQQHGGQLARFEDAVCIAVSGFDNPYNAIVAQRMSRDAAQAGLKIAQTGCPQHRGGDHRSSAAGTDVSDPA